MNQKRFEILKNLLHCDMATNKEFQELINLIHEKANFIVESKLRK